MSMQMWTHVLTATAFWHRCACCGHNMLFMFSLVCQLRGCIVSNQMLHNNCCSLFTSFSPLFIYTQQLCSFYEFILPEDISFSCMCLACKSNNLEDLGGRGGGTWQEWGGVFEGGFIPQCTLCYTFMWHSRAVNQHLNLLQSPKKHTLTAVTGTKPKKHRLNLS